jgi:mono/diheme cytochrome c family protein
LNIRRPGHNKVVAVIWTIFCMALLVGCAQNMRDIGRLKPYEPNAFFENNQSARPLVPGTVARGQARTDEAFYTGMQPGTASGETETENGAPAATTTAGEEQGGSTEEGSIPNTGQGGGTEGDPNLNNGQSGDEEIPNTGQGGGTEGDPNLNNNQTGTGTQQGGEQEGGSGAQGNQAQAGGTPVEEFPFVITAEIMERGQSRYNIFCAPCHALTGDGDGQIVRRGFSAPPSLHSDRLRDAPVGHYYDVITNGFGRMYSYSSRVTPADRWAIIAYIRALQLSQNAASEKLSPEDRTQLEGAGQ